VILTINTAPVKTIRNRKSARPAVDGLGNRNRLRRWLLACASFVALSETGCVSRRLMVQSNPPGAMVLAEGREIGYTPTAVDFTYYGTRELTLIKDGYETTTRMVPVRPPWYERFGVDFFSEHFLPFRVTDRRSVSVDLPPKLMVPNQELLNRGTDLRNEAQIGQ
jgi:hypothetical protein